MRILSTTVLVLLFFGCGTTKKVIEKKRTIESLSADLDYQVVLPENWEPILNSHNDLSYSPKDLGDIFYKNIITIFTIDVMDKEKSFKDLVLERILKDDRLDTSNLDKTLNPVTTKYGETFITKHKSGWYGTSYIYTSFYFYANSKLFNLNFTSTEQYFEKYVNDVDFIFNNLVFYEDENMKVE